MATVKAAARTSPVWSFLLASMFALLVGTGIFVHQQYQLGYQSDTGSKPPKVLASSTAAAAAAAAAAVPAADQISSRAYAASSTTVTARTESHKATSSSVQTEHVSHQDSALPLQLQGVPFNVTLGCWHVLADPRGDAAFYVAAQADFEPGQRWEEAKDAISRTRTSNPGAHYILVPQTLGVIELAAEGLKGVPYDLWYCPQVLYGTPIQIGNLYRGPKFAVSVDDWFPPWEWQCKFKNGTHSFVYVVQRQDKKKLSGYDRACEETIRRGGADGFLFDHIPEDAVDKLRFPRSYWGCENIAMFVLDKAGLTLVNMCPWYVPVHVHRGKSRKDGRLRINNRNNHIHTGHRLDVKEDMLCQQKQDPAIG